METTTINGRNEGRIEIGTAWLHNSTYEDGAFLHISRGTWGTASAMDATVHLDACAIRTLQDALATALQEIEDNDPVRLRKHAFGLFKVVFGATDSREARHVFTRGVLGLGVDPSWRDGNLKPAEMRKVIQVLESICEADDVLCGSAS